MNAVEIESAVSELAALPFDRDEFPYAFLQAFGNKDTTIKRLKSGESNKSDVGGVLQTKNIHILVAELGSVSQALAILKNSQATGRWKASFILATDGQEFMAEDLESGEPVACAYADFPDHFGFFLPLAGITTVKQIRENAFDIRATSRLNKLYMELLKDNPDWASASKSGEMNHFMARLIFCFFAEDTGIFNSESLFTRTVEQMSSGDSSNTHEVIAECFRAMNTRREDRPSAKVPRWAEAFPYVNGGLFSGSLEVPRLSRIARRYLLFIGQLDWTQINPDIFGSMIQAVADDEERGALGMHYTSVPNILKVLNPLFLDDLRSKLEEAGDNQRLLLNLRKRLSRIRVFDPACGSGNFLVIAYKQMREIEAEIIRRRNEPLQNRLTSIPLTNFRGIELRSFPAEIARLALVIAEYQCNQIYLGKQHALDVFLPLSNENWITCGNALRMDWQSICPPTGKLAKLISYELFSEISNQSEINFENEGGETFICGNPPYLGAKKKSKEQSEDLELVGLGKAQLLDYVCGFIVKGLELVNSIGCEMALVATSSICQGEQVALLWPRIFKTASVKFAYSPFRWANSAANNAGVFCTILGLVKTKPKVKRLYYEDSVRECESISPYLVPGPEIICYPRTTSISGLRKMVMGSNPVDGKKLILEQDEYKHIVNTNPGAQRFFKMYGGTQELVNGVDRWCLWINDSEIQSARLVPEIATIIDSCRSYRLTAGRDARKAANRPHAFCYSTYEEDVGIQIGLTIGNGLSYIPAALRTQGFVSSHTAYMIYGYAPVEFSLILSRLMKVWTEAIGGRLGNGMRYSNTIVYNTFPVPTLTDKNRADLRRCAENIMLSREAHFPKAIADLYGLDEIPSNLEEAHDRNDEVIERIYIGRKFRNDTERLEKLFELYGKMTTAKASI